jgi:glycosyltransferase involved in cell wall biosynthesis
LVEQQPARAQRGSRKRVGIYHNSLWARYKGAVYSALHRLNTSHDSGIDISFVQIAETDLERVALGDVDLSYHQYPYRVLLRGAYGGNSTLRRALVMSLDLIRHPTDLVVLSGYDRIENWAMLLVCMLLGRKRAVACDSTIFDRPRIAWKSWAKKFFFARCDGFIGYGQRSKQYMMSLGAHESDIVIPCLAAAMPHDYDPSAVLARYREQPADAHQPPRFLYVGRLAPEKGLGDLIDAFRLVQKRLPGAHLDIIGAGGLEADLVAQRDRLGLTESVTLHGPKDLVDIVPLFARGVAMVLPSHREPWGLVVNEALSFGCPVVVSAICGCVPELVVDGVTGFTFETGNVAALSEAMLSVLRLSEDRLSTARQCLQVVSAYSAERAAARMLEGCTQFLRN